MPYPDRSGKYMNLIYRHWRLIRRIAISLAVLSIFPAAFTLDYSGVGWIFALFLLFCCVFGFVCAYWVGVLMRAVAEMNHALFKSMNPKATWMQVGLLWFSVIGILLLFLALAFPPDDADMPAAEFALGLCTQVGLFVGSGNFLVRERNQTEQTDADDSAALRDSP